MSKYAGLLYRESDTWKKHIPLLSTPEPLRYLEIGVSCGKGLITFIENYGQHDESEFHGVDPWLDYAEYPEFKGEITKHYELFMHNLSISGLSDKKKSQIKIRKGFSIDYLNEFEDEYFDIIYIDGNHETPYVLKDAELSLKKVKHGGYIVFDDYLSQYHPGVFKDVNTFCDRYKDKIRVIAAENFQMYLQKL